MGNYFFKSDATCVVSGDELHSRETLLSEKKRNRPVIKGQGTVTGMFWLLGKPQVPFTNIYTK